MDLAELQDLAQRERQAQKDICIRCCTAASCLSSGSQAVVTALSQAVADRGLSDRVQVKSVGCLRLCCAGPLVQVSLAAPLQGGSTPPRSDSQAGRIGLPTYDNKYPLGSEYLTQGLGVVNVLFEQVTSADAPSLVEASVNGSTCSARRGDLTLPFFTRQTPIVLENSGVIEPERIESYLAVGGYQALHQSLFDMTPAQVIDTVTRSGLRGRGGAGYPTGVKWSLVAKMPGQVKYVVCNADEGDPGAFMDRSVLESDPHRVLEGMAIAAHAVGASQGYIYVRGEYPLAIHRLETAIRQARRLGVLGTKIFDSPFDLRIDLRIGAGAFVCGEETALIASVEGRRGTPQVRPPYPAEKGLWECPTLINNVETFANIAPILTRGADWFAGLGTARSKGTKVFALAGKIRYTGLVEVPMGMPLRTIVEDMGGKAPGGTIKAVQTGGPSGGCIPAELLDTSVDYESLQAVGSIMGSGGMIVMDQTTNMVEVAKFFMEFCMDESCGKCVPCRAGTVQLHHLLVKIAAGRAGAADLRMLETLCDLVKHTSLCGLGQSAPNPVLSTLKYFRTEYEALLQKGVAGSPMRLPLPLA